ncbi:MAG: hypothetical protein WC182_02195 [Bacilli bacterium]|jgi:hypothetical protein
MGRKNIFETLASSFDAAHEIRVIDALLMTAEVRINPSLSIFEIDYRTSKITELVDQIFYTWRGRGTAVKIKDFRTKTGIDAIIGERGFNAYLSNNEIITYLEFAAMYMSCYCLIYRIIRTNHPHGGM